MEKTRRTITRRCFKRLLVLFTIILFKTNFLYAALPSASYISSLKLSKVEDYFFTATNCSYSVDIKGVDPSLVKVYVNSIPNNVELVSIKKETYIPPSNSTDTSYGTHVIVTVKFSKPGNYKLFAVDLLISGGYYKLPFESVYVYENTQILEPKLEVKFTDDRMDLKTNTLEVKVGEHISYTVYIKYAAQISSLSWNLPENSYFEELTRYDIAKKDTRVEFTPESQPVITFDWQPLASGEYFLPSANIYAVTYSGLFVNPQFPQYKVKVLQADPVITTEKVEKKSEFESSFLPPKEKDIVTQEKVFSSKDFENLLYLHCAERHALPFSSLFGKNYFEQRKKVELEFGLVPSKKGANVTLFFILLALSFISVIVSVFVFASKKIPLGTLCVVISIALITVSILLGVKVSVKKALCKGGELFPIPEKDIAKGLPLQAGSVVKIEKKAGSWVYVSQNETYGWIPESNIVRIE